MAYETGTATSQQDLIEKLFTFATGQGWTQDQLDTSAKQAALHKNNVYVSFRWDAADAISVYQALGYTGGSSPGNHPNDSGSGQTAANPLTTGRRINRIGNGPFPAYYFFADDTYIHVALEFSIGLYRFISFGEMVKRGTWTGGEFAGASLWAPTVTGLNQAGHYALCDWRYAIVGDPGVAMTVHAESLPSQVGGGRWGVAANLTSVGNDRGGTARALMIGGVREGFFQVALGWMSGAASNGFVPMFPLHIYYRRTGSPETWQLLGHLPGVRFCNIKHMAAAEEFTVGGDTWKVFPWVRKSDTVNADESGHMGFSFLKTV